MSRKNRILFVSIAIVIVLTMILGLVLSMIPPASAAPSSPALDRLRRNASGLEQERKALQRQLNEARENRQSALEEKVALDRQIENTDAEIENTSAIITLLLTQIEGKEAELTQALADEARQYELFKTRIRAMEEAGDTRYLDILLGGDSYSDMLGRMGTVQEIVDYDQNVLAEMKRIQDTISEARETLERDRTEQQTAMAELEARKAELTEQCAEQIKLIEDLEREEAEYNKAMDEAEAAQNEMQAQINAELREIARRAEQERRNHVFVGGQYNWPLPGYTDVSSGFGNRQHPVYGGNRMHTGIDIPAPKGTKIRASNAGTVIRASYNSGYGNCVVVDHGGGQATLYAHMSKIMVSEGQSVAAGDIVGLVGSTGVSTGNHLHFEVIINGDQVNPLNYVRAG